MDKYPLIGVSIIAVVLLILGSLTNVVGYQTVQSSNPHPIVQQIQKEKTQSSNSECDCENSTGVTSWPFPFICATLGAIGVLVVLLTWNTDIGDNLLTTILILYELFNCG
ncbi:Uncharacterised protein [uncultured archaeon]|nr:Uncharacterised protein [uncultured archaeon]